MLTIVAMLLAATFLFHSAINYMADNISDFENVALPPKKPKKTVSRFSMIKVDATSKKGWALLDFTSGKTHKIGDLEQSQKLISELNWDVGFRRTSMITNGGETNPKGNVGVVNLGPHTLEEIKEAPKDGYVQDKAKWGSLKNGALKDWYIYRTRTHNIESKKNVYVIRTQDNEYVKMRVLNYYCQQEEKNCATSMCSRDEAACITLEYMKQPNGVRTFPSPTPIAQIEKQASGKH